ncbi:B-box zinc finger protein 32-like [Hibiscus syriacus]|uniref:B-box zinc finger protein 32-like n=1 Tax=Hibiscus syriacus TaxID=106335 RepID=UPI001924A04E|nr:B-box zinc finger protein 32-like [Hibiscus syriacus]
MKTGNLCELCKVEASVYCSADSALLCWKCDHKVHHANFLVARHLRQILCSKCKSSSHNLCKASSEKPNHPMACSTFSSSSSSSSSSHCLSTSESSSNGVKPKRVCVTSTSSTVSHSEVSDANGLERTQCNLFKATQRFAIDQQKRLSFEEEQGVETMEEAKVALRKVFNMDFSDA